MKAKKKAKKRAILTVMVIVGLVVVLFFASKMITNFTGKAISGGNEGNLDDFTKCLAEKGVKMYGAYWCPHCQNQKALFKNSAEFMENVYIECDSGGENPKPELCQEKGIGGYPTWEINGNMYPGEKSLGELAGLSGCKLR